MRALSCAAWLVLPLFIISCERNSTMDRSETNWVITPEWTTTRNVANKRIPILDKMGLRYQVVVHTRAGDVSNTDKFGPFASNEFVGVDIFNVSHDDCETLRKHFSNNRSQVHCSETPQDYAITDFLDPAIQASVNSVEQNSTDTGLNRTLDLPEPGENCWALAYEIARLAYTNKLDFHTWDGTSESGEQLWNMFDNEGYAKKIPDSSQMMEWGGKVASNWDSIAEEFKKAPPIDDKYNRPGFLFGVLEKYAGKMPDPSDNTNLQPGDVLLVGSGENLAHAAIFVAPGLYFERTQGNTRLYGGGNRLVFSTEIVRMYTLGEYSHWRVSRDLPVPQKAFHYTSGAPVASRSHEILFDQRGVAYYAGALKPSR
jgi:hypothetical protein